MILTKLRLLLLLPSLSWAQPVSDEVPCLPTRVSCNDDYEYRCADSFDANGCELNHICKMKTAGCPEVCPEPYDSATQLSCPTTDDKGCDTYKIVSLEEHPDCSSVAGGGACNTCPPPRVSCNYDYQYRCADSFGANGCELSHICKTRSAICTDVCPEPYDSATQLSCLSINEKGCDTYEIVNRTEHTACPVPSPCGQTSCNYHEFGCLAESACEEEQYTCHTLLYGLDGRECPKLCHHQLQQDVKYVCPWKDANGCPVAVSDESKCPEDCSRTNCFPEEYGCPRESSCADQQYDCIMKGIGIDGTFCNEHCNPVVEEGEWLCHSQDANMCPKEPTKVKAGEPCPGECNSLDKTCEQGMEACPYDSNCDQQQYYCNPVEAGGCALQCPLIPEEGKVICPQTHDSSGCPEAQVAAIAAADCPGAIGKDEFSWSDLQVLGYIP